VPSAARLALGAAGAALALDIVAPAPTALLGGALVLLSIAFRGRTRVARGTLAITLGFLAIGLRGLAAPGAPSAQIALPAGDGPWTASVVTVGSPKDGSRPAIIAFEEPLGVTVATTLPWYPAVVPGDRIETTGSIRPPPPDDYGAYLARVGAVGTLRAASLRLLPPANGPGRWLEGLRRGAAEALDRAVPEPEAGLAAGILIGLRDRVDRDLAAAFTTAGASHVVAISGWNIAIVATSLGALVGGLGRRRRTVLTAIAILAYVLFVGPSPSVVRAAAMACLALLARELGRPSRAAAAMGWAVTGLLLVDPAWIDDAGFRLSVLATAGLMAWGTSFAARLAGPSPGRVRRWVAESLGVTLAAQAATLPVILLEFGRLSLVAPLVNLGVVPLVAPAMAAGAVALVGGLVTGSGLPLAIATIGGLPAWVLLGAIVGIVRAGASVPLASVTLAAPWDTIAAVAAALVIVVVARFGGRIARSARARQGGAPRPAAAVPGRSPRRRRSGACGPRGRRLAVVALAGATVALALAISHRPDGATRVTVLDVGQGDAILVEGGRGGRMLVDGGPDPGRLLVALDERLPAWDHRIDILVLTHPHEDHVAGLPLLLGRYRIGRVYEPGMVGSGPGYAAWAAILAHGGPPHGTLSTGDRLSLDDVRFEVLWPDRGRVPIHPADGGTAVNDVSIVLLGEVDGHRFLLTGDIEQAIDPELLARGLPTVDLLKVAHHGSRTASTEAFLAAVRPRIAVVSVGTGNPFGHPAPSTIDHLRSVTRQVYRTDLDGTVEVRFDGEGVRVRASGARTSASTSIHPPVLLGTATGAAAGEARMLLYHRADDGPLAIGGGVVAPLARSPRLARPARRCRRGDRGVARRSGRLPGPRRRPRPADRPAPRGGGRAPPRRRQDPARGRSGTLAAPWRRLGSLAGGARPRGARGGRARPPDHATRRRGRRAMARRGQRRGTAGGVCGSPGRPAPGADGRPLRRLGDPLPQRLVGRDGAHGSRSCRSTRAGGLSSGRLRARGRAAAAVGGPRPRDGARGRRVIVAASVADLAPLAYYWGDDAYGLDAAVEAFRLDPRRFPGGPPDRWRLGLEPGDPTRGLAELTERLATGALFGGGSLVVASGLAALVRGAAAREALLSVLGLVAPGNGLAIVEETDSGRREPPSKPIADSIRAAGGEVRTFQAPREGSLAAWIEARARERRIALGPGAARELATRVGGFVREGDVDRRHQARLAVMELEKLSLRRLDGTVTTDDVRALVAEAIPGTIWGFVDAVATRQRDRSLELMERLLEETPEPVLLAVLHRRLRDLIEVLDRLERGESPGSLVRSMRLAPFRAETLARQVRGWTADALDRALESLLELDAQVKGVGGRGSGGARDRLAFDLWITDRVAPA
jgi:competence protein ComEC